MSSRRRGADVPLPLEVDLDAIMRLPPEQREEELARVRVLRKVLEANPLWRRLPHLGELGWKQQQREKLLTGDPRTREERMRQLRTRADLQITGDESRGQVEFLEADQKDMDHAAAVAGNRWGKSEIGVIRLLVQTLPRELIPPWFLPYKRLDPGDGEIRFRIVGPDLPQWLAKVMIPKCRMLIPAHALHKGDFDKAYNDRDRLLRFADGSWWDFLTHPMPVNAFAGADVDGVWWDEEPPGEHGKRCWEESLGRIVDREGDMRYTLTPLFGLSWLYYELTGPDGNPRQDGDDVEPGERTWVVTGDIDHNPHLTERGKRKALKPWAKDPLKLEARKKGRWIHFEGLVYPEFHTKTHVVEDRDMPRNREGVQLVPVVEQIDPGIADEHGMAFVAWWMNPDGQIEVFHALKLFGATVREMADHIKEVRRIKRFKPKRTKIDPSARNRNPQTGKSIKWAFQQQGIHTELGNNDRETGINEIKQRLRAGPPPLIVFHADGASDLVHPMEGEFVKHRWKKPVTRTEDAPKPDVIKKDDDCLDALRYGVVDYPVLPPTDRDPHDEEPEGMAAAFREQMKRIRKRRGRRGRVGGVFR